MKPPQKKLYLSICKDPDNDEPRLAYADWLEANGIPLRAEFIRIQCRLAQSGLPREKAKLSARESELLDEHGKEWQREHVPKKFVYFFDQPRDSWGRKDGWPKFGAFKRGFVDDMQFGCVSRLQPQAFPGYLASHPFRRLHICSPSMEGIGQALAKTPQAASLRHIIHTRDPYVDGAGKFSLEEFRVLILSPHLGNLKELNLGGVRIPVTAFAAIAEAKQLRSLQKLCLSSTRLGDKLFKSLADFPHAANLRDLQFLANGLTAKSGALFAAADSLTGLTHLDLSYNEKFGDRGVESLLEFPHFGNLKKLSLDGNKLTGQAGRLLAAADALDNLKELSLIHNDELLADKTACRKLRQRFGKRIKLRWREKSRK